MDDKTKAETQPEKQLTTAKSLNSASGRTEIEEAIREYVSDWAPLVTGGTKLMVKYDEQEATATAISEPRYKEHTINFNIQRIQSRLSDSSFDLEEHVVHELCHVITWRAWQLAAELLKGKDMQHAWTFVLEELHEEATTKITWALLEARYCDRDND